MSVMKERMKIIEPLRPIIADDEMYGRIYSDLHDLIEASEWLLTHFRQAPDKLSTVESFEEFLIDLDVYFIQHVTYHLSSLRPDVEALLGKLELIQDEHVGQTPSKDDKPS